MTDWTKEEDEAFNVVEQQSNLGKQILKAQGQPYHFDTYVSPSQRNHVLEEVALEFDKMPFGDTAQSFAAFVRNMKSCPPCHGNCYQGRTCPQRNKCLVSIATPQRTWVGLTDKDWNRGKHNYDFQKGVDWAESILKEKNA